jgi:hypothetical protein
MVHKNPRIQRDAAILADAKQMEQELREAIRDALRDHKLRGDPIAVAENGRVIWIPADKISILEADTGAGITK